MKKRILTIMLAFLMIWTFLPLLGNSGTAFAEYNFDGFRAKVDTIKASKPEGTVWTNNNSYPAGWYGCWAFANYCAEQVFGCNTPRNNWTTTSINSVMPGDIISTDRWNGSGWTYGHTMFVIGVFDTYVSVAEGNYSGRIHYDRHVAKNSDTFTVYHATNYDSVIPQDNHNPKIYLDVAKSDSPGSVYVKGWAFDPDNTAATVTVHVYGWVGNTPHFLGSIKADLSRPDVNNAFGCGKYHGFSGTLGTSLSGSVNISAAALNIGQGDTTWSETIGISIKKDSTAPVVSNVKIISQTSDGYTISCNVTDSGSGVNRIQFPTWTTKGGQDDLVANWTTNSAIKGTKSGDTYTFQVKRSAHNNEYGEYITDIYAWDNAGNETGLVKRFVVKLEKPHTHSLVRTAPKAATTTAEGNIEYWTCSSCGKIFKDAEGKIEITKAETVIPKLTDSGSSDAGGNNGAESAAAPATQMGTDGTPLGNGASIAAAEAAIAGMPNDNDLPGSVFGKLQLRSKKQTKTSVTLSWKKIPGATSYVIYGNKCGRNNKMQRLATSAGKSMKFTSVLGRKVKKGTYYKFMIIALDNNNKVVSASKIVHVATKGGKVGNVGKVTTRAKKNKVSVKTGKTFKLSGKQKPADKKLKVKKHRPVTYESSNPQIATVSKKGVIKGNARGTCYVYAYAQNGVFAKVKITVK